MAGPAWLGVVEAGRPRRREEGREAAGGFGACAEGATWASEGPATGGGRGCSTLARTERGPSTTFALQRIEEKKKRRRVVEEQEGRLEEEHLRLNSPLPTRSSPNNPRLVFFKPCIIAFSRSSCHVV